jgi:hypothetical protein
MLIFQFTVTASVSRSEMWTSTSYSYSVLGAFFTILEQCGSRLQGEMYYETTVLVYEIRNTKRIHWISPKNEMLIVPLSI